MTTPLRKIDWATSASLVLMLTLLSACSSDGIEVTTDGDTTGGDTTTGSSTTGSSTTGDTTIGDTTSSNIALNCEEIAAQFVTRGSANPNLADPEVSATCSDGLVSVTANGIPDFPYIATSPGDPAPNIVTYTFPEIPTPAAEFTAIPIVGSVGVAINGIPIYGPTEGPGGDVLSRPGGFNECGGHNGPTGYHYHLLGVTGTDYCLFTAADVTPAPILFGYALDGYPIYTGNTQYTSSWFLEDESLFATDTWSAHTYSAGSGDLDECNGRTDANGNYAYYTTDTFPYVLGCFRGVVELATNVRSGATAQ